MVELLVSTVVVVAVGGMTSMVPLGGAEVVMDTGSSNDSLETGGVGVEVGVGVSLMSVSGAEMLRVVLSALEGAAGGVGGGGGGISEMAGAGGSVTVVGRGGGRGGGGTVALLSLEMGEGRGGRATIVADAFVGCACAGTGGARVDDSVVVPVATKGDERDSGKFIAGGRGRGDFVFDAG